MFHWIELTGLARIPETSEIRKALTEIFLSHLGSARAMFGATQPFGGGFGANTGGGLSETQVSSACQSVLRFGGGGCGGGFGGCGTPQIKDPNTNQDRCSAMLKSTQSFRNSQLSRPFSGFK